MKLVRWKRFTWNLKTLPALESKLPAYFTFRAATREEERIVNHLVFTAFSMDMTWNDTLKVFRERLEFTVKHCFEREGVPAIVVSHGPRIIAASVLSAEAGGENNLVSGPCVLPEYCNRGLGTALLHCSLRQLREAGLDSASGVTKENVPSAKFIYPKFGSTGAAYDYEPMMVGS